ncbi:MAG: endolytic transglycosylase MltG [Candidatus Saccharibacteria bacterium]|nr:endolytic transglycosylase MltG [Candidatus Saccharibacteria bacterium]
MDNKGRASRKTTTDSKKKRYQRRPSFEIAADYIEFNFRPIIEADAEEGMTKRQIRKKRKAEEKSRRRHYYIRNSIIAALLLIAIAATTVGIWWKTSTSPVDPDNDSVRQFVVDQGATTDQVADALRQANFIRNELAFKIYVRLHGSVIQAGTHMLSPSDDLAAIVTKLATADTDEISIQIPPGLTLNELRNVLRKYDYTDTEIEQALNKTYDNAILADKPAGTTLEGYLYPDTYRVLGGDGPEVVIGKAIDQLEQVAIDNGLIDGFAAHGLSFYEGLTLASIVTKEVQGEADQQQVAGVFYNRLNAGMNLGSDVTYQYAYKSGLCSTNTPNDCDSIYNTRIYQGLPPGPIANPSLSALKAVANPATSNYYYFVAGEDGNTYYSETADQHNQAVANHCGSLCEL